MSYYADQLREFFTHDVTDCAADYIEKLESQVAELESQLAEAKKELDKARQPVSDYQLVSLLRVLTNGELPMEETRSRINYILERK